MGVSKGRGELSLDFSVRPCNQQMTDKVSPASNFLLLITAVNHLDYGIDVKMLPFFIAICWCLSIRETLVRRTAAIIQHDVADSDSINPACGSFHLVFHLKKLKRV